MVLEGQTAENAGPAMEREPDGFPAILNLL
jgi:hypothetical protein